MRDVEAGPLPGQGLIIRPQQQAALCSPPAADKAAEMPPNVGAVSSPSERAAEEPETASIPESPGAPHIRCTYHVLHPLQLAGAARAVWQSVYRVG